MTPRTSEEQVARLGELELAYQTFGEPGDPAALLIMGLGAQMIHWPIGLCEAIADRGFFVVRFDNRDSGGSTKLQAPAPLFAAVARNRTTELPYRLEEMAADAVGLLDFLGIERAHVVGASLGGMIAQRVAIDFPDRVLSLASIMSTTGNPAVGQATPEATEVLMTRPALDRDRYVEGVVAARRVIGSVDGLRDEEATRTIAGRAFDRGIFPAGTARQLAAIRASPDRTPELGAVAAPTVVIHGAEDTLIHRSGGEATAAAIEDAELVIVPGMGHDLPAGAWDAIVEALVANVARARRQTPAGQQAPG